ncbi:hypothetical protein PGT21_019568 [Puccinia graminis f. sp. tritici]|uniref:Uncharacterized protein n=1 Tax=Puccinia graminis f. sp. tritici TaxID=56615 RepID=A0A5B0QJ13_PUCGR|nr:hypothetical protein PGT21_019568 [Puccinia graminis f. sp. tritici]
MLQSMPRTLVDLQRYSHSIHRCRPFDAFVDRSVCFDFLSSDRYVSPLLLRNGTLIRSIGLICRRQISQALSRFNVVADRLVSLHYILPWFIGSSQSTPRTSPTSAPACNSTSLGSAKLCTAG